MPCLPELYFWFSLVSCSHQYFTTSSTNFIWKPARKDQKNEPGSSSDHCDGRGWILDGTGKPRARYVHFAAGSEAKSENLLRANRHWRRRAIHCKFLSRVSEVAVCSLASS